MQLETLCKTRNMNGNLKKSLLQLNKHFYCKNDNSDLLNDQTDKWSELSLVRQDNMMEYIFLSCTCSIWAVKLDWPDKYLLYTVTDQDIVFLVTDSCWVTVRNGNSISADRLHRVRLEWRSVFCIQFWFFSKDTIGILSENIKSICARCEIGQKCYSTCA
jgi:hypothetical protein